MTEEHVMTDSEPDTLADAIAHLHQRVASLTGDPRPEARAVLDAIAPSVIDIIATICTTLDQVPPPTDTA
jgi:hypothetical protein